MDIVSITNTMLQNRVSDKAVSSMAMDVGLMMTSTSNRRKSAVFRGGKYFLTAISSSPADRAYSTALPTMME